MLIHADFYSKSLWRNTELYIALPSPNSGEYIGRPEDAPKPDYYAPGKKWPTLVLMHCGFGGASEWVRFSSIERYAQHYKVAVVMPSFENSCGVDMAHGPAFYQYLSKELFEILAADFPVSLKREQLYIAGASVGGYAAYHLMLNEPEKFGGMIALSSMLDFPIKNRIKENPAVLRGHDLGDVFPDPDHLSGTQYDLYQVLKDDLAAGKQLPRFYVACGLQDRFLPYSLRTAETLRSLSLNVTEHNAEGRHTWAYWDGEIDRALAWMTEK